MQRLSAAERPTRKRHVVLGFALGAMVVAYLDRVAISTAAPAVKADLGLSDVQMGLVFSAFTLAYALFEVPSGWLADRFGSRWMLTRIVLWWSAMTAATGAATGFLSLLLLRWLFGMGEAGVLPSISRAFGRWLPAHARGNAFGLTIMAAALGGAATQPIVVWLLTHVSWRSAFPIFGSVGVVWAVAWLWWFRDEPREHRGVNAAELALIGGEPQAAHPPGLRVERLPQRHPHPRPPRRPRQGPAGRLPVVEVPPPPPPASGCSFRRMDRLLNLRQGRGFGLDAVGFFLVVFCTVALDFAV